MFVVKYT